MKLILASNSPRRKEILENLGYDFTIIPSNYEEKGRYKTAVETAEKYAYYKALDVYKRLNDQESVVLGADTVVNYGDKILEKPRDREDAKRILMELSGKTHKVITGYAVIGKGVSVNGSEISYVRFRTLTEDEIREYIDKNEPFDKAGAYGIQDEGSPVESYSGSFDNVVGLPSEKIKEILKEIV